MKNANNTPDWIRGHINSEAYMQKSQIDRQSEHLVSLLNKYNITIPKQMKEILELAALIKQFEGDNHYMTNDTIDHY